MLGLLAWPLFGQAPVPSKLDVLVTDASGKPLIGVRIELVESGSEEEGRDKLLGETDELGRLLFANLKQGRYTLTAKKTDFETVEKKDLEIIQEKLAALELVMVPPLRHTESIEVHAVAEGIAEDSSSAPTNLSPKAAKELPSRPATVSDALPLTPGVLRQPGGGLILSSSPENRSALIVNSADVTDPATGQFGLTVPIDSVEVLNVYQTAYLAEYGRFTSGLVSVETKKGGDKWNFELNDPLPEFWIRSWHLRGLRDATPRVNFEGPIIANKLFVSEGLEYEVRKTAVYELPFPFNQKKQQGLNTFTQFDWVASPSHLITGTIHLAPQRQSAVTLDYFNPLPTTPDISTHNYTGTVFDRLALWKGTLENRFSYTRFDGNSWGQGTNDFMIGPAGNQGDYFAEEDRTASRYSGASDYAFAPLRGLGTHQLKFGGYAALSGQSGDIRERPIDIVYQAGLLLERITFPRIRSFDISDTEKSFFGQDHWILTQRLAVDVGVRTEAQQISGAIRVAPRVGLVWTPPAMPQTVIRAGFGLFYDRVPLNVYGFNRYPSRFVTMYDAEGNISAGPFVYLNTLGQSQTRFPFVSQSPIDGNFSPRGTIATLQIEQQVTRMLKFRATYLYNDGDGLVVVNTVAPDPVTRIGRLLLEGTGQSRYRQFDVTAQLRLRENRYLFFSYVHSLARGDLNDFGQFLGTVPVPIIRPNSYGTLGSDIPNRFLVWGLIRLPEQFQIAPVLEYRNGFPYIQTDALQNYVGIPYSTRFPNFLSLDARFSKDVKFNAKYTGRFSVSSFNLTNHFNPEAIHGNIADGLYGTFFGHRGRRFTVDFD